MTTGANGIYFGRALGHWDEIENMIFFTIEKKQRVFELIKFRNFAYVVNRYIGIVG